MHKKSIFEPQQIGNITLRNGFVRSATFEGGVSSTGHLKKEFIQMYEDLSEGRTGLIITGMMSVTPKELPLPGAVTLYSGSGQRNLRELVDIVHSKDGKIMPQLAIMGSQVHLAEGEERQLFSPSGIQELAYKTVSQPLSVRAIKELITDIANGAKVVQESGADGVQLHGAHGYLLSHFLTPYYNHRDDNYGGSLVNRARFIIEAVTEVRKAVGSTYPLWLKLNCDDFMEVGGYTFEECKQLIPHLEQAGIDCIEISGGSVSSLPRQGVIRPVRRTKEPMYFLPYGAALASQTKIPIGVVGGFRSFSKMETAFASTDIAFISMSRPFIRDPHFIGKAYMHREEKLDLGESLCISCNRCMRRDEGTHMVQCIFHE